jgi:hypothetical protein
VAGEDSTLWSSFNVDQVQKTRAFEYEKGGQSMERQRARAVVNALDETVDLVATEII